MLADLAARLGLPGPDLALVLAQPGVVTSGEAADLDGGDRPAVTRATVIAALDAALAQLDGMREAEGNALAADLYARLDEMVASSARIAALAAGAPHHIARRLTERVKRLLEDTELEPRGGEDPAVRRER